MLVVKSQTNGTWDLCIYTCLGLRSYKRFTDKYDKLGEPTMKLKSFQGLFGIRTSLDMDYGWTMTMTIGF